MGTKERRQREKDALKQKILDAATELFTEDGYKNVTMRKIANKIEYSLPTIYEHFGNKAEILLNIYHQSGYLLLEKLQAIYDLDISPLAKIEKMGRAYVSVSLENRDFYELTFLTNSIRAEHDTEGLKLQSPACKTIDSPAYKAFTLLVRVLEDARREGVNLEEEPMVVAQTLWAGLHGLVSLMITNPEFPWVDRNKLIDNMLKTLRQGSIRKND